jgi:DNA-binding CsgD family transcriptional regulator
MPPGKAPNTTTLMSTPPTPPAPEGVEITEFCVGDQRYALLSLPATTSPFPGGLTEAEWLIGLMALAGHSNATMATMRGVAPRTIANQLASLYRKLGVSSRGELAARWPALFAEATGR